MKRARPSIDPLPVLLFLLLVLPACSSGFPQDVPTGDPADPGPYGCMAPAGPTVDETLGIASHMSTDAEHDRDRLFELDRSVEAGVHFVRRGFYWNRIEPENDVWTFQGYDVLVDLLHQHGLAPLAMITRAVRWAAPGGSPNEIDPDHFADFAGQVAARYAHRIDLYEIWNEQNSERFWNGGPDPAHYGRLLRAAHTAIHRNDPSAVVLFGGLSAFDPLHLFDPRGVWNFLARTGEAHPDLCDFMDGVAIHPYTFLQQPEPELSLDFGVYRYPDLRGHIRDVRGMLEERGCPEKPIHLTEAGWPSLLIGLERQAAYLARGVLLARAAGAASFFWYTFYDEEPVSSLPTEDYFGLYTLPDGRNDPDPKPSYRALLGLHRLVGKARFAGDLGQVLGWDEDRYALVFSEPSGAWTVALWHAQPGWREEVPVEVPLPADALGTWTLFDQEGVERSSGDARQAAEAVPLSGRVHYLRFFRAQGP